MNKEDNNSNDDYDMLDSLVDLGKQVSDFLEEDESSQKSDQLVDDEQELDSVEKEVSTEVKDALDEMMEDNQSSKDLTEDQQEAEDQENVSENQVDTKEDDLFPSDETYIEDPNLDEISDSLANQVSSAIDEDSAFQEHLENKKKKRKKIIIISASIVSVLAIVICIFAFNKHAQKAAVQGIVSGAYDKMFDFEGSQDTEASTTWKDDIAIPKEEQVVEEEDNIVNILLIGVEEIGNARNTDSMIIATMNRETHELSVISLMRDLYVQIPGHNSNKLNAAFSMGGISLLYQTIYQNFGVQLDGYIEVNFEDFETIVNLLGGVSITLTSNEAAYLNRTNYISNKAYRNVRAGSQVMNGNQALGYCRVRYVSTGKESNDFGRTSRHRVVLNAMFDKLKHKNVFELIGFMNDVLSNVQLKTDITKNRFSDYATEVVDLKIGELKQYRIPSDDGYYDDKVYIGEHKQSVLQVKDWSATKSLLHEYIYGKEDTPDTNAAGEDANDVNSNSTTNSTSSSTNTTNSNTGLTTNGN